MSLVPKLRVILALASVAMMVGVLFFAETGKSLRAADAFQKSSNLSVPASVQTPPTRMPTAIPDAEATARTLPPTTTPEPPYMPPPDPTLSPPPMPTVFAIEQDKLGPNIAWGIESEYGLAIWVGRYTDGVKPSLTGVKQVARWIDDSYPEHYVDSRFALRSMAVSPDQRSLAIILAEVCVPLPPAPTPVPEPGQIPIGMPNVDGPCMGDAPEYIFTVDYTQQRAWPIPDYFSNYDLYAKHNYLSYVKMLGWFDNSAFGLNLRGTMYTAARDGSSLVERKWPDNVPYDEPGILELLADGKTLLAGVSGGFYRRDVASGEINRVGDLTDGVSYSHLVPSPDGSRILHQEEGLGKSSFDFKNFALWVQEIASGSRVKLIGNGVWDTRPAWSSDGSQVAWVHADLITGDGWPTDNELWWMEPPVRTNTNIYTANADGSQLRKLTNFPRAQNSGIQWTPAHNLVLSSTAAGNTGTPGLIAVSTQDGTVTTLVPSRIGEAIVRPLLFGPAQVGMPRAGSGDEQP